MLRGYSVACLVKEEDIAFFLIYENFQKYIKGERIVIMNPTYYNPAITINSTEMTLFLSNPLHPATSFNSHHKFMY